MAMTASKLRENIYKVLDSVVETGVPVEIARKGGRVKIVRADDGPARKLDRLTGSAELIVGDPDDLVHMDWSQEWKP